MEIVIPVVVGALVAAGLFLVLRRNAFGVFLGVVVLSHGVNLLLFSAGGLLRGEPPILEAGGATGPVADPVPQALTLTAIVIGLAVQVFLLALLLRLVEHLGAADLDRARASEPRGARP